jgi:hypothetical protein
MSPRVIVNNLNAARVALRRVREADLRRRNTLKYLQNAGLTYKRKLKEKQKGLRPGALPHNAELYKNYYTELLRNSNAYRNYAHLAHNFLAMMSKKSTGFRSPRSNTITFDPLKKGGRYPQHINKKDEEKIKKYARYLNTMTKTLKMINFPMHNNLVRQIGKSAR